MQKTKGCAGIVALALLAAPASAEEVLHLYAWDGLFDQQILDGFTAKTGIEVTNDSYDSDETLETKLLSGESGYDFVLPSATPFLTREIAAGALEPLNKELVPNYANQIPELLELLKKSDPNLEYSAIAGWGTTGLAINVAKVRERLPDADLNSYDLIFKPENVAKLADCGVAILDSPTEVVPIVLNYLGLDPSSQNEADLDKAMELLQSIRPHVQLNHPRLSTDMATGDVCAAIGYSGDVVVARAAAKEANNGVEVAYVLPKEGTLAWISAYAIPMNPPNPAAAHAFMDYMLSPEVAAQMTALTGYATGVNGARELLPKELAEDPAIFFGADAMAKLFVVSTVEDTLSRQRNRAWTRLRTGE